jgi:hypothetical protein
MGWRFYNRPHLVQRDSVSADGELPGGLRSGQPATHNRDIPDCLDFP